MSRKLNLKSILGSCLLALTTGIFISYLGVQASITGVVLFIAVMAIGFRLVIEGMIEHRI